MSSQIIAQYGVESNNDIEIITGTGEILEDKSSTGRVRPWSQNKKMGIKLIDLYKLAKKSDDTLISDNRLVALDQCGDFLKFGQYSDGTQKLAEAHFCGLRLCPQCNWRRSLKLFAQVSAVSDAILHDKPSVRFLFVTFTIRNIKGNEIKETLDCMNKGFQALTQSKQQYKAAAGLQRSLLGYMKATEITYNSETNTFHPHLHVILEVDKNYFNNRNMYISQAKWRQMWQEVMHLDYEPLVNVKAIKTDGKSNPKAVAEVAKYPVKSADILSLENKEQAVNALIDLHRGIYKRQFITFGGDFRRYKQLLNLDDVEKGDLVHVETESISLNPVAYVLYRWRADVGAYIC